MRVFVGADQRAENVQLIKLGRAGRGFKNGYYPSQGLVVIGFGAAGLYGIHAGYCQTKVGRNDRNLVASAVL